MFLLPALGTPFTPKDNDQVSIDSVIYTVKRVQVQFSGEQIAYWDVVVGR
jgi:hypothetical protein